MGENGAGKSTLIKAITGALPLDEGELRLDGEPVRFATPHDAQRAGISTVYQEIDLLPNVSVAENIALGREPRRFGVIDWRRMRPTRTRGAGRPRTRHRPRVDPRHPLARRAAARRDRPRDLDRRARCSCSTSRRRASTSTRWPSCSASSASSSSAGVAILFVSHFLDQVYEICDRVTVLRDGRLVGEYLTTELLRIDLVQKMLGPQRRRTFGTRAARRGRDDASRPRSSSARGVTVGAGHRRTPTSTSPRARCSASPACSARGAPSSRARITGVDRLDAGIIRISGRRLDLGQPARGDLARRRLLVGEPPHRGHHQRAQRAREHHPRAAGAARHPAPHPSAAPARARRELGRGARHPSARPRPARRHALGRQPAEGAARADARALAARARARRADARHRRRREGRDPEPRRRARRQRAVGRCSSRPSSKRCCGSATASRSCATAASSTRCPRRSSRSTRSWRWSPAPTTTPMSSRRPSARATRTGSARREHLRRRAARGRLAPDRLARAQRPAQRPARHARARRAGDRAAALQPLPRRPRARHAPHAHDRARHARASRTTARPRSPCTSTSPRAPRATASRRSARSMPMPPASARSSRGCSASGSTRSCSSSSTSGCSRWCGASISASRSSPRHPTARRSPLIVSIDQYRGARSAVRHLAELGHHADPPSRRPAAAPDAIERVARLARRARRPPSRGRRARVRRLVGGERLPRRRATSTSQPGIGDLRRERPHVDRRAVGAARARHPRARGRQRRRIRRRARGRRTSIPPLTTVRQDFAALGELIMQKVLIAVEEPDSRHRGHPAADAPHRAAVDPRAAHVTRYAQLRSRHPPQSAVLDVPAVAWQSSAPGPRRRTGRSVDVGLRSRSRRCCRR